MCYSAEVSFLTWGFGMMSAAILAFSGTPLRSFIFPLLVSQMQLIEGLRWKHAVDERLLAIAGKFQIFLQPVAAMIEGNFATKWILLYVVVQSLAELLFGKRDLTFKVQEDGHFKWNWLYDPNGPGATVPYQIALLFSTYFIFPVWIWAAGWGMYAYYYIKHRTYGTFGSLWCVSGNFLWIYYLLR